MKLVDLRKLPTPLAPSITDAKEGLVDALLNLTWQRCSGDGPEGEVVFGTKPSLRFVSGFLLPRYEETGQRDETSDIHISTHGVDCQIVAGARGSITISVAFSIYVRAMPTWRDLIAAEHDLFPNPPLRHDLEPVIRDAMKQRLAAAKAEDAQTPQDQRRDYRSLQQELYHAVLAEHGVRVSADGWVADATETTETDSGNVEAAEASDNDEAADAARLVAQRGRYIFDNDAAAQEMDLPQKWRRLPVRLDSLTLDLSDAERLQEQVAQWTRRMRAAVNETVAAWLATGDGRDLAYRPAGIRPSHVRSEQSWNALLAELRKSVPAIKQIAPNLDGLLLNVGIEPDLRDSARANLRIVLENNSADVGKRRRHRFEHAIHQVRLTADLPAAVHRSLRLDRVEPSYRFRDFLTYAAMGVNCGVDRNTQR